MPALFDLRAAKIFIDNGQELIDISGQVTGLSITHELDGTVKTDISIVGDVIRVFPPWDCACGIRNPPLAKFCGQFDKGCGQYKPAF